MPLSTDVKRLLTQAYFDALTPALRTFARNDTFFNKVRWLERFLLEGAQEEVLIGDQTDIHDPRLKPFKEKGFAWLSGQVPLTHGAPNTLAGTLSSVSQFLAQEKIETIDDLLKSSFLTAEHRRLLEGKLESNDICHETLLIGLNFATSADQPSLKTILIQTALSLLQEKIASTRSYHAERAGKIADPKLKANARDFVQKVNDYLGRMKNLLPSGSDAASNPYSAYPQILFQFATYWMKRDELEKKEFTDQHPGQLYVDCINSLGMTLEDCLRAYERSGGGDSCLPGAADRCVIAAYKIMRSLPEHNVQAIDCYSRYASSVSNFFTNAGTGGLSDLGMQALVRTFYPDLTVGEERILKINDELTASVVNNDLNDSRETLLKHILREEENPSIYDRFTLRQLLNKAIGLKKPWSEDLRNTLIERGVVLEEAQPKLEGKEPASIESFDTFLTKMSEHTGLSEEFLAYSLIQEIINARQQREEALPGLIAAIAQAQTEEERSALDEERPSIYAYLACSMEENFLAYYKQLAEQTLFSHTQEIIQFLKAEDPLEHQMSAQLQDEYQGLEAECIREWSQKLELPRLNLPSYQVSRDAGLQLLHQIAERLDISTRPMSWRDVFNACDAHLFHQIISNIDVNLANTYGNTLLFLAAQDGHTKIVRVLLEAGANVNLADRDGNTPLSWAAQEGRTEMVRALIGAGAEVNRTDNYGETPLCFAAKNGHIEIVRVLLGAGADVNLATTYGRTPLFIAVAHGHAATVKALIEAGAEVNLIGRWGMTPLIAAALRGNAEMVRILAGAGADVNLAGKKTSTPLFLAAKHGHTATVKALIEAGADVNLADTYGDTPLVEAADQGHTEIVRLLKEEISLQKALRASLYDVKANDEEICKRLAQLHTIDLDDEKNGDHQLLFHMAKRGFIQAFDFLMARSMPHPQARPYNLPGDDINRRDEEDHTALYHAVKEGQVEMVKHILNKYQPDLTINGNDYDTLLSLTTQVDEINLHLRAHRDKPTVWTAVSLLLSKSFGKQDDNHSNHPGY